MRWNINHDNAEKEVVQLMSESFVLAIPDLSNPEPHWSSDVTGERGDRPPPPRPASPSSRSPKRTARRRETEPVFEKQVWRLRGNVQWGLGMLRERTCEEHTCVRFPRCSGTPFYRKCRFFDRISHWDVVTKTRAHYGSLPEKERVSIASAV